MIRATKHPPEFCVNNRTEPDAHGTYHLLDSAVYFGMTKAEENFGVHVTSFGYNAARFG